MTLWDLTRVSDMDSGKQHDLHMTERSVDSGAALHVPRSNRVQVYYVHSTRMLLQALQNINRGHSAPTSRTCRHGREGRLTFRSHVRS